MKAKDLILELLNVPPDTEIYVWDGGDRREIAYLDYVDPDIGYADINCKELQ